MLATFGFSGGRIGTGAGECAVKIHGGNDGFFKTHTLFWTIIFALLLNGAAEDLSFDAARGGGYVGSFSRRRWNAAAPTFGHLVAANHDLFRSAVHFPGGCGSYLLLHFFCLLPRGLALHKGHPAGLRADVHRR